MKRMIVIYLIAVFFTGSVYAEPCFKEQPFVSHAASSAPEMVLWNQLGFNPKDLEGCWSRCNVMSPLKHTGKWFAECGAGFETMGSFFKLCCCKRCKKTDFIELKVGDVSVPQDAFDFMGTVNVRASKGFTSMLCLMHALKTAMDNGGDSAVLCVSGMNPICNEFESDVKLQGEAVVVLKVYKRNLCAGPVPIESIEPPCGRNVGYYSYFARDYCCNMKPQVCCYKPCCLPCKRCCCRPCRCK